MQQQVALPSGSRTHVSLVHRCWVGVTPVVVNAFLIVTALAAFVPLNPRMPETGLDASWEFAMNEAVARHLSFGKAIVFTYGPYASIGTRTYSPATDLRMMTGSIAIGACYVTAILFLADGGKRLLMAALLLFLTAFASPELLLFSYSLLLPACVAVHLTPDARRKTGPLGRLQQATSCVMWSTLGVLPLVKGSLLVPFLASIAVSSALLAIHARTKDALLVVVLPTAACLAYWSIAGQSLFDLPGFLEGTMQLTAGYTEAMSTSWGALPPIAGVGFIAAFLAASVLATHSIVRSRSLDRSSQRLLALLCALLLFVTFKHGFVAVANVSSVFAAVSVFLFILCFVSLESRLIWLLWGACLITMGGTVTKDGLLMKDVHKKFGIGAVWSGRGRENSADILNYCVRRAPGALARTTYMATLHAYAETWRGIRTRASGKETLNARYERAKNEIRLNDPLPQLRGTVDMYEYDQSALLASGNDWNPRPIVQSYSAYTPQLAGQNERHLRDADSPDWVLFRLESIDGRLPSLDDGLSWPALLDNYTFMSFKNDLVSLQKTESTMAASSFKTISKTVCSTGMSVTLPDVHGVLFAEVDLRPTWLGRLLIAVFSPPQLEIKLGLRSGKVEGYRVVAEMMTSGFVLSPLIGNTADLAALLSTHQVSEGQVRTMSIAPSYGGTWLWSKNYGLVLKEYAAP